MLQKIFLATLLLGSCAAVGYKYPSFRSCCNWKPSHGPHGIPHSPRYINYQSQYPVYGVPSHNIGSNNFAAFSLGFSSNLLSPPPPQGAQGGLVGVGGIGGQGLAHHKVLAATEDEAQLPAQLLNPFYKNPAIREALAKHSWFGPGEKHVGLRETDRISRQRIYEVLSHAGFIRR